VPPIASLPDGPAWRAKRTMLKWKLGRKWKCNFEGQASALNLAAFGLGFISRFWRKLCLFTIHSCGS